jgi:phenol 2-monooxygenase (NADPH)
LTNYCRHVHSVLGAFGLNSSIYDATNLSWKLGLSIRGIARPEAVLPTYDSERRLFANRVIRVSGAYLRFICRIDAPLAELRGLGPELEVHDDALPSLDGTLEGDLKFRDTFFGRNAMFLVGVDAPIVESPICPATPSNSDKTLSTVPPTSLLNGARAPSPRVALTQARTGYLYDAMPGIDKFHILLFASDLQGPVRSCVARGVQRALSSSGFYSRFGGKDRFNLILVLKALSHETEELLAAPEFDKLREEATVVWDDRAPDDDAHYIYGINHARGAVVVVRPDLRVGVSAFPEDTERVEDYFAGFLNATLLN